MEKTSFLKEPVGGQSVVNKIVDNITNAIINGELNPGDKIPTEAELSESMGAGRNSVREAIKVLEAYGVVHIKRAEGTFVLNPLVADPRIHQQVGAVRTYVNTVAAASAGNTYHSHVLQSFCLIYCILILFFRSLRICFLVSSTEPLLSITASENSLNPASGAWLSMMLSVFSCV